MKAGPSDLLTALLDACRRGLVTHEEAARLVGIHKREIGDLVAWRMVEVSGWRTFIAAFHHAFPECNASLWHLQSVDLKADELWRGDLASTCRQYTADEAAELPPSHVNIFGPEPGIKYWWENKDGFDDRPPARPTRAPPRDTGWQPDFDCAA